MKRSMNQVEWLNMSDCSCKLSPNDRQAMLRAPTQSYVYKFALEILYPHWNAQELPGASPPGPPPGALYFAQVLLNQWGTQPSLAHGHPRAKLRHCHRGGVTGRAGGVGNCLTEGFKKGKIIKYGVFSCIKISFSVIFIGNALRGLLSRF